MYPRRSSRIVGNHNGENLIGKSENKEIKKKLRKPWWRSGARRDSKALRLMTGFETSCPPWPRECTAHTDPRDDDLQWPKPVPRGDNTGQTFNQTRYLVLHKTLSTPLDVSPDEPPCLLNVAHNSPVSFPHLLSTGKKEKMVQTGDIGNRTRPPGKRTIVLHRFANDRFPPARVISHSELVRHSTKNSGRQADPSTGHRIASAFDQDNQHIYRVDQET